MATSNVHYRRDVINFLNKLFKFYFSLYSKANRLPLLDGNFINERITNTNEVKASF